MPQKILVVEDTEDAREILKTLLELEGFDVVLAGDGFEALELAPAESPDLIVTDISMPRVNGIEMIQRLRATANFKNTPILALTSHGVSLAMDAIRAGANRALSRPVQNHLLLAFVSDLLVKG